MNIISLYCNKTCINYASLITIYRLIVIQNCRLNYTCWARANCIETNAKKHARKLADLVHM